MPWVRTCQECFHKAEYKAPDEYKGQGEPWRDTKCKKCSSEALDFGKEREPGWEKKVAE